MGQVVSEAGVKRATSKSENLVEKVQADEDLAVDTKPLRIVVKEEADCCNKGNHKAERSHGTQTVALHGCASRKCSNLGISRAGGWQ